MMRILIVLLLSLIGNAYSQSQNSLKQAANTAEKMFTWDIVKSEKRDYDVFRCAIPKG